MSFTTMSRTELQQAFAVAHKCSQDAAFSHAARRKFRAIATLIWRGHGEPGQPPAGAGADILAAMPLPTDLGAL